jgi:hypothetical protein
MRHPAVHPAVTRLRPYRAARGNSRAGSVHLHLDAPERVGSLCAISQRILRVQNAENARALNRYPEFIGEINRQLQGWANYFSIGYPRAAYWEIDWYVRER